MLLVLSGLMGTVCFLIGQFAEMLTDVSRIAAEVLARQSDRDHRGQAMIRVQFIRRSYETLNHVRNRGFAGEGTRDDLARMNAAQASRGPDGEGIWADPAQAVFLGHLRLSIIDLAGGTQPMWTADGDVGVVFNGEIYNHVELRAELKALGATFVTDHSDTEVLLHAYRIWGDGFVSRLNGMWAFVIYDRPRRRLFASRDRFGKKTVLLHASTRSFRIRLGIDLL
jgi:asparagine synthetase B (glutamine-hydrolysing)